MGAALVRRTNAREKQCDFYKCKKTGISSKNEKSRNDCPPDTIKWSDTQPYILTPIIHKGRVIKVYDGDTITVAAWMHGQPPPLGEKTTRFSIRLNRIDCPEKNSKNPEERSCAELVQKKLEDLILGEIVELENLEVEKKWKRLIAEVYYVPFSGSSPGPFSGKSHETSSDNKRINLSDYMLENRLAVPYDGGKKTSPQSWADYMNGFDDL